MPDESNKYEQLATSLVTAMKNVFIEAVNKVTSWSQSPSHNNIPSEKLVYDSIEDIDAKFNNYATLNELTDVVRTSNTAGLIKNDGTIDSNTYLTSTNIAGKEDKSNKINSWSATPSNDNYPSELLVKNSLDAKANVVDVPADLGDLTNNAGYLTTHQTLSEIGGEVTVEKQQTAETGYSATYVIKQNGSQVGTKINIPKDFLVKDAGMGTVATANNPVSGYKIGDKYLWFKVNTADSSATDQYLYILVTDLIDVYDADNATLEMNNNTFKVKNGGIGTTQLSSGVNTSLGYADAWNSSPAKTITSADITRWDTAGTSNLSITDVDNEIESYLEAIITELNS